MKTVVVARVDSIYERARLYKLCKLLDRDGKDFVVWKLPPKGVQQGLAGERWNEISLISFHWRRFGMGVEYLVWAIAVLLRVLLSSRENKYYCLAFESAFPVALVRGRRGSFFFDNADNFASSHKWPRYAKLFFQWAERFIAVRAKIHLVPGESRWPVRDDNLRVVKNTPSKKVFESAISIARDRHYKRDGEFTLYVNGWLSSTRGIATLVKALGVLEGAGRRVNVLIAGRSNSPEGDVLIAHPFTEYLGSVSNEEALAYCYRAHLVFTFYDPSVPINVVAEPNKWGDCIATGTPFLANSEIETAQSFYQSGCCFLTPYSDHQMLADVLWDLKLFSEKLVRARNAIGNQKFVFWDDAMERVLNEWISA